MHKISFSFSFSFSLLTIALITFMSAFITPSFASQSEDIPSTASSEPQAKEKPPARVFELSPAMSKELFANMVLVEAGTFNMGSDSSLARAREKPVKEVSLDSYYIGRYEVTQDVFLQIMGWNTSYFQCEKCPMNNVSWFNIQLFIERLNMATGKTFSLPTEAQWAFAAKGGNQSKNYDYSGSNDINDVAWYVKNSNNKSHPVGLKQPNELGLYDMTGNLWEFCLDTMSRHAYKMHEQHNPFVGDRNNLKQKAMKVIRGGGYEFSPEENLLFMRDGATNNVRMADIGFRLVLEKK